MSLAASRASWAAWSAEVLAPDRLPAMPCLSAFFMSAHARRRSFVASSCFAFCARGASWRLTVPLQLRRSEAPDEAAPARLPFANCLTLFWIFAASPLAVALKLEPPLDP